MGRKVTAILLACFLLVLVGCSRNEGVLNTDQPAVLYPSGGPAPSGSIAAPLPTENTDPSENTEPTVEPGPWTHEAALIHLLEETNQTGEYLPSNGAEAPGSLTPVDRIPAADQSRVGETVPIILAQRQQTIPFYFRCTADGNERLAVFINAKIPMLVIFETDIGGIRGLYEHIQAETVFSGKILSMTNLDKAQGSVYARNCCADTSDVRADEILTDGTLMTDGGCVGIVGTPDGGVALTVIKGGIYECASDGLKFDIDWMHQVFRRYSLENLIPAM